MERNVQRINGEVEHLHLLTNDQLNMHYYYAGQRRDAAVADMETVAGEIHRRANVELPLAELAIESYAEVADCLVTMPEQA